MTSRDEKKPKPALHRENAIASRKQLEQQKAKAAVVDAKAKAKAADQAKAELKRFFEDQEALEDAARDTFEKYDADFSGFVDLVEMTKAMEDLGMLGDKSDEERAELTSRVFKESDDDKDSLLSYSEFTKCYNALVSEKDLNESKAYNVPSIFGHELSEEEQQDVRKAKAMLDRSIFAPRKKESPSGDYHDTVGIRDKMFKLDWSRIDKKKSFVQFKLANGLAAMDKESGKAKNTPLALQFKKTLRQDYDMLCNSFTYFCCLSDGNPGTMSFEEFKAFAKASGLRDKKDPDQAGLRGKFLVDLSSLFKAINEENDGGTKKQKAENEINDNEAFLRFEFLEAVMHMSVIAAKGDDVKQTLNGFLMFMRNNLDREPVAARDRSIFRKDRLYTIDVMETFKTYQTELRKIFLLAGGEEFHELYTVEFDWLCDRLGLIDVHLKEPEGIHVLELRLCFTWSQMLVADEIKGLQTSTALSFIEFLELLGRVADVKDLVTKELLEENKMNNTLEVIEKNEALMLAKKPKPPVIPKLASSCMYDPAPKPLPLNVRLRMLLDFIFLMMAPGCGSVLLGTYTAAEFHRAIDEECTLLYGKLLWPADDDKK
mmetsp:Transcript_7583/g.13044  ORF Transcript_7583/g.13044 Transcript_7583/m.13044 type:complete len:600 (+) Transcript_7583:255-2054(+)